MRGSAIAGAPIGASAWGKLRRSLPAGLKGVLRRQAETLFPNRETREYGTWTAERVKHRAFAYREAVEPGLFSILTPVWNGSPPAYLKKLAQAIIEQNQDGACEWVILDNGCSRRALKSYLEELGAHAWVKLIRSETNCGIIAGLRRCLEAASGRYVLPVDADDLLYPDALRVVSWWVKGRGYPPLLYTDEDKIIGQRRYQPYMKPDWDPVLLLNSAYIAHLNVIDREKAIELGAYTDPNTEGSPDWDIFVRFLIAGHEASHIPEVLYSWRVHARSTADDAETKPYVRASQQAVLRRFLDSRADQANLKVEHSPLLGGMAHFHISRQRNGPVPISSVVLGSDINPRSHARAILDVAERGGLVQLAGEDVRIDGSEWQQEAQMLFELHPELVMIGGRIRNSKGVVLEAGRYFGFGGVCGCPYRGRSFSDPGYFGQMWKQRSVSAVATQFAVVRASFLADCLTEAPEPASLAFLGAWAGALAMRTGKRVAYSPFLSGVSETDWEMLAEAAEVALFARINRDLIPDRRFYSRNLSLQKAFALGSAEVRREDVTVAQGSSGGS